MIVIAISGSSKLNGLPSNKERYCNMFSRKELFLFCIQEEK